MNVSPEMSTQEQVGLLGGFGGQDFRQCRGGDVGVADEPYDGAGTAFAVFHADGHRQFSHSGNHVTSWLAGEMTEQVLRAARVRSLVDPGGQDPARPAIRT